MKKYFIYLGCFLAILVHSSFASSLDITVRGVGLSIGNSRTANGLRLNFVDRDVRSVNGVNITFWKPDDNPDFVMNGLALGLVGPETGDINGLALGGVGVVSDKMSGISLGLIGVTATEINGIAIGGIGIANEDLKGIVIGGLGAANGDVDGIAIGGFGLANGSVKGIAISMESQSGALGLQMRM